MLDPDPLNPDPQHRYNYSRHYQVPVVKVIQLYSSMHIRLQKLSILGFFLYYTTDTGKLTGTRTFMKITSSWRFLPLEIFNTIKLNQVK
jgi:hypothetical protein